MPFDGMVTAAVKWEMEQKLLNSRIDRISQPARDEVVLGLRQPGEGYRLLLSANPSFPRVNISAQAKEAPSESLSFCMALRKHLRGARLLSIDQPGFDRILHLKFETYDDFARVSAATVVIEIMGKHSNIALVDSETGTIMDCIKHVDDDMSRVREMLPGKQYTPPPDQGKLDPGSVDGTFFTNLMLNGDPDKQINKTLLTNFNGFSPVLCREICVRAGLSQNITRGELTEDMATAVWQSFRKAMDAIGAGDFEPAVYVGPKGKYTDFHCMPLSVLSQDLRVVAVDSVSEAVERFYSKKEFDDKLDQGKAVVRRVLRQHLERCDKKLSLQEDAKRAAQNAEGLKMKGDILMANLWALKKGVPKVSLPNLYSEDQAPMEIPLDPSLSGLDNAQKYYRKYAKARNSITVVEEQLAKTWEEVTYLGQVEVALDNSDNLTDVAEVKEELVAGGYIRQNKKPKGKNPGNKGTKGGGKGGEKGIAPIRFTTSDGYEVLVGKNNRQNDVLTMKMAQPGDLWFHTKDIPGSHVILRTSGAAPTTIPDTSLLEAAMAAASYSKAKGSSNVPVDYTLRKNVKKPPGSKPGMVIYDSQRTLYVTPEIADTEG